MPKLNYTKAFLSAAGTFGIGIVFYHVARQALDLVLDFIDDCYEETTSERLQRIREKEAHEKETHEEEETDEGKNCKQSIIKEFREYQENCDLKFNNFESVHGICDYYKIGKQMDKKVDENNKIFEKIDEVKRLCDNKNQNANSLPMGSN